MSDDPAVFLKAMLWEEAKGKLRALVAVKGSYTSPYVPPSPELQARLDAAKAEGKLGVLADLKKSPTMKAFEACKEAVETFIDEFETDGLHE